MTERDDEILFNACNPEIRVYNRLSTALSRPRDWSFSFNSITPEERANRNRLAVPLPETTGARRKRMLFENMELSLQQIFWETEIVGVLRSRLISAAVQNMLNSVMDLLEESRSIIIEHYFSGEFKEFRGQHAAVKFEPSRIKRYQRAMLQRLIEDMTQRANADSDERKKAIQGDLQTIGHVYEHFGE